MVKPASAMLVTCLWLAAGPATALHGLSPTADHDGFHAGDLTGGRMASVVIDPTNSARAFAAADSGGIYATSDGGATWETAVLPSGLTGKFGHGFEGTGINSFHQLAISPDGSTLLLLAGSGSAFGSNGGVWRSIDGGKHWLQPANPSPAHTLRADSQIAFSSSTGWAYAVAGDQLGISKDGGASFSWVDPFLPIDNGNQILPLDGLDVFPKSDLVNPFGETAGSGGSDALAFCITFPLAPHLLQRAVAFYNVRNQDLIVQDAPPTDHSAEGGVCQVAFDPRNGLHLFVASQGIFQGKVQSGISEGTMSLSNQAMTWIDLKGSNWNNGRPVFVQTRSKGETAVTVYYHDSAALFSKDCNSSSACAPGGWTKLTTRHPDAARIAFKPGDTGIACPLLLANDGGIETSPDCGFTWLATNISGLHATMPWMATFAGQALEKAVFLDLQDNGTYFSRLDSAELINPAPGEGVSFLPWFYTPSGDGFWSAQMPTDPTVAVAAGTHHTSLFRHLRMSSPDIGPLPAPPKPDGTPLKRGAVAGGEIGVFVLPGLYALPLLDSGQHLQMWLLDTATGQFSTMGGPSMVVPDASTGGCDIAVSGELDLSTNPNIFLIQGKVLWVFDGLTWTIAGGPKEPLRVWGDSGDSTRAYVLDQYDDSMWKPGSGVFLFEKDLGLTQLATNNGKFVGLPNGGCSHEVCSVAFDPADAQRIAVGTGHAGILVSADGGGSWSHAAGVPEPNGGVTGLYYDFPAGPNNEDGLAASFGQGLWAVSMAAAKIKMPSPVNGSIAGNLAGVGGDPVGLAKMEVRIVDTRILARNYAAAAREQTALDPLPLFEELDVPSDSTPPVLDYPPITVGQTLVHRGDLPPPPRSHPRPRRSEVVADFIAPAPTDAEGRFRIALPHLEPGRYFVQVIFAGDEREPRTTAGVPYQVPCDGGDDGDRPCREGGGNEE